MKIKTTTKDGLPRAKSFKLCGAKVTHWFSNDIGMVQLRYDEDAKMYVIYFLLKGHLPRHLYFKNLKGAKKVLLGFIKHTPIVHTEWASKWAA